MDVRQVLRRLAREEASERSELARLEARLRRYEDVERPAYEAWLRLELGPAVTRVEELAVELRARQILAARVSELVEVEGLHAREALWMIQEAASAPEPESGSRRRGPATEDPEAVEARRRAKRERKRAERRQAARERQTVMTGGGASTETGTEPGRKRLVGLYRDLARSLHPDSPHVLRELPAARLRSIWAEVQAAYALRSLERLLALATWVETVAATGVDAASGEAATERRAAEGPTLSLAERHERLRALRRASRVLDRRLASLATEAAWDFEDAEPPARRKLKQAAARRLASEAVEMTSALRAVDDFLDAIGPPRRPRGVRAR
jgi:hypothetical protein